MFIHSFYLLVCFLFFLSFFSFLVAPLLSSTRRISAYAKTHLLFNLSHVIHPVSFNRKLIGLEPSPSDTESPGAGGDLGDGAARSILPRSPRSIPVRVRVLSSPKTRRSNTLSILK